MGILISLWKSKVVHIKTLILHTLSVVEDKISSPQSYNLCQCHLWNRLLRKLYQRVDASLTILAIAAYQQFFCVHVPSSVINSDIDVQLALASI